MTHVTPTLHLHRISLNRKQLWMPYGTRMTNVIMPYLKSYIYHMLQFNFQVRS